MENQTENLTDADTHLDQDIFIDNERSSDNHYSKELENIKNKGIEGKLEPSSALNGQVF